MMKCNLGDIIEISNKKIKIKGFIEEPFIGASNMGLKQFYLHEKDFNDNKDDPRSQEKMEAKINKLQEMFNKEVEDLRLNKLR